MIPEDLIIQERDRVILKTLPKLWAKWTETDTPHLVSYFERIYKLWNLSLDNFLNVNDLEDFTTEQLNSLAVYFGFTGNYFNTDWNKEIKVKLFKGVYQSPFIWKFLGSRKVLEYIFWCFDLDVSFDKKAGFIAGINKAGDVVGYPNIAEYLFILNDNYSEGGAEFELIKYIITLYFPVWCRSWYRYRSESVNTARAFFIDEFGEITNPEI